MASRLLSFGVWGVLLATAVFWGLKIFVPRPPMPPQAQMPVRAPMTGGGDFVRLMGASLQAAADDEDVAPAEAERFRLLGVVAPRGAGRSAQGVALISVDDEPARAVRTGAVIVDDLVLLAVDRRSVKIGPAGGPATTDLTLPDPQTASAGAPGAAGLPALNHAGGAQAVQRPGLLQQPGGVRPPHPVAPGAPDPQQNTEEDEEE